jgi:hypothetical protein
MVHLAQTVHLSCLEINTISKQTETSFRLKRFPYPLNIQCKPCNYLQLDRNKLPLDLHYLGVPSGVPKVISMPAVDSSQIMHLSCTEIKTISKWIKRVPLDPRQAGVPSVAPKMISEAMVRSEQTVHLSCIEINTISKKTKTIFHLIYAT